MSKPKSIDNELSRCINQLLLKEPFYAHILGGTVRVISDEIDTAAVGIRNKLIVLLVNEEFFLKSLTTTSGRVAVLKHETLHLVFRHLFREPKPNHRLMNIAADIVVNQYIGGWDLPEDAVTLRTFPDLDLTPGESLEYYYKKLDDLLKETDNDSENQNNKSKSGGNKKKGKSNNADDNKMQEGSGSTSADILRKLLGQSWHSDHSLWTDKNDPDAGHLEHSLKGKLVEIAARTPSKSYGNLPGEILRQLDIAREDLKPKVNWKRQIRQFAGTSGRSRIYHTMKRVSKRYGTRPGIRIIRYRKLAVVVDTSGSISNDILKLFFNEITHIHKNGADLVIIECDAAVQQIIPFRKNLKFNIKGGGGTDYDPAFQYLRENRNKNFDGCIYLTDGYAPEPKIKPPCRLLYVITPNGNRGNHLTFGRSIKIKA